MMKLGKNTDTILFGSGVFILVIAIVTLAVIQAGQDSGFPGQTGSVDLSIAATEISTTPEKPAITETAMPAEPKKIKQTSADEVEIDISPGWTSYKLEYFIVRLPDGAVDKNSFVVLSLREPDILSLANKPGWEHILMANIDLTDKHKMLLPSNRFAEEVETCFELDENTLADYLANAARFRVEIFNSESNPVSWEALPTHAYPEDRMLCGETRIASLFALAVQSAETPSGDSAD